MFDFIDIHSHLYFPDFDSDRDEELLKLQKEKIATITIGVNKETSQKSIDLAKKDGNLFATVGLHPDDLDFSRRQNIEEDFSDLARHQKVVAIGECGLDYFRLKENVDEIKKIQKDVFEQHIDLSLKVEKPLMLHIRASKGTQDAYLGGLDILENYSKKHGEKLKGNAHFFAGDMEVLKRFLAIGFTVSFTGVITFTHDYDELIKFAPLDMIMSETDSPFVSPVPYRGKRNSPLYVPEVVKAIAQIRGEDYEIVRKTLKDNAVRSFKIY